MCSLGCASQIHGSSGDTCAHEVEWGQCKHSVEKATTNMVQNGKQDEMVTFTSPVLKIGLKCKLRTRSQLFEAHDFSTIEHDHRTMLTKRLKT